MNALSKISKVLFLLPLGMFLYDVVKGWFVDAKFEVRSLKAWWLWFDAGSLEAGRKVLLNLFSAKSVESILAAPAPLVFLAPPVVLYALYRLFFFLSGGKNTGGYTYKSRH